MVRRPDGELISERDVEVLAPVPEGKVVVQARPRDQNHASF